MKNLAAILALATLIPNAAFAADVFVDSPSTPLVQTAAASGAYDWTGFYIGLQGGILGATLEDKGAYATDIFGQRFDLGRFGGDFDDYGAIGGAHVGYDYQIGSFVVGAEADIQATNTDFKIDGTNAELGEINYIGTVRGKLGFAMDRTLVYAHGGLAYAQIDPNIDGFGKETEIGYVVGAGLSYAMFDNITVGTEYKYQDIGDFKFRETVPNLGTISQDVNLETHSLEARVSYRF